MSLEKNLAYIGEQLKSLTAIASPTGFTKKATEYLCEQFQKMGYEPELSNKGNINVDTPAGDLTTEGSSNTEITNFDNVVFKRVKTN